MVSLDSSATATFRKRNSIVLICVGLLSSLAVYAGHDWFHGYLLPLFDINAALGDAVGGFIIILVAYLAQHVTSLVVFKDGHFGLLTSSQQLQVANAGLKSELSEADRLASTDRLTGCWNRHRFDEVIAGEIDRLVRYEQALSLLIIDIDHFKSVNDTFGHGVGDSVLIALANLLRSGLRSSDSLTRWGGEEFVILCPNTSLTTAVMLAERLRENVAQANIETVGAVTVSIGVAECLIGERWQEWLNRADAALYRAKHGGRNRVSFAPEVPPRIGMEGLGQHKLVQLAWDKAYESGHPEIDRDHLALFSIANDIINALVTDRPHEELCEIVDFLLQEVTRHFEREEAFLVAAGYPDIARHAKIHRHLLNKAGQLANGFRAGTVEAGGMFHFLAHDVISKHVLGADREFFPLFRAAKNVSHPSP